MKGHGKSLAYTVIMWRVHQFGPESDKRICHHLKQMNDPGIVNKKYINVKGQWIYLYLAVDAKGDTMYFF